MNARCFVNVTSSVSIQNQEENSDKAWVQVEARVNAKMRFGPKMIDVEKANETKRKARE